MQGIRGWNINWHIPYSLSGRVYEPFKKVEADEFGENAGRRITP
jgi:hypothetical protein